LSWIDSLRFVTRLLGLMALTCAATWPLPAQNPATTATTTSPPDDHPIAPRFTFLRLGEVKPSGWIKEQMRRDLDSGFAGHLDALIPKEAGRDIFATGQYQTNSAAEPKPLPGAKPQQPDWWTGETEGNWRTGFVMMAYLSDDRPAMARADAWVAGVLAAQKPDGYMGIHGPALTRYTSGELWTQACLMRGLLDYFDLTGRQDVLTAVKRAADLTMRTVDPIHGTMRMPWGQTHDLMFLDVIERLYDLTGDPRYRDFGVAFYEDYSKRARKEDASLTNLLDLDTGFIGHGVHAWEHIRVPLWLYYATGRDDLGTAWKNAMIKTERYAYPGQATVSQEDVGNRPPDPSLTEFEYCAAKELQWDLELGLQMSGDPVFADRTEQLWFNDEQAARAADGSGLTYLTSENRTVINRTAPDGKGVNGQGLQPRNLLSPIGGGVACCCPPNSTQVAALYVHGMWMRDGDHGLAALLYGPCTVSTTVGNDRVTISEQVEIKVEPEHDSAFTLLLRNPGWSKATTVTCPGARISSQGGYWKVSKTWQKGDALKIVFAPQIFQVPAVNGEIALQYGPLLYALPIPSTKKAVKKYPVPGFADYFLTPTVPIPNLSLPATGAPSHGFQPRTVTAGVDLLRPFDASPIVLDGSLVDTATGKPAPVTLVPLGQADGLRRLTFPRDAGAASPN
jgi:DUF1680 family protein